MRRGGKLRDREALHLWESFHRDFARASEVDRFESQSEREARRDALLNDFAAFAFYYFPRVCKSDFAPWHLRFAHYLIANDRAFAVAKVSRDMAKSSLMAMLVVYLYLKGEARNVGLFAHIQTQAVGLLSSVRIALERNQRILHDFGNRVGMQGWQAERFATIDGCSFRAVGAGQNPRGEKNEDSDRFDLVIFDDFDDPEVCRNPERLDLHWKYVLGDVLPAMHVSGKRRIVFLNNQIDEDCVVQRAWNHAIGIKKELSTPPLLITVNLTDADGHSMWPAAYTDEQCKEMIALVGEEAETEYFNRPAKKGTVFKKDWFQFKKLPPLSKYKYLLAYHDGGFKNTRTADTKALVCVGLYGREFHIRRVFVDNTSIAGAIAWHYELDAWRKEKNAAFPFYMEEVFLLSLLYEHFDRESEKYGYRLPIQGDKRKKPDKDLRISNTAGHFERGQVFFDQAIENDPHTRRLIDQYMRFRSGSKSAKDGPDAIEGAFHLLGEMAALSQDFVFIKQRNKRY